MTRRRQIGTGGSTVTRVTPDELYMRATALGWHGESSAHCYCEFKARKHDEAAGEWAPCSTERFDSGAYRTHIS